MKASLTKEQVEFAIERFGSHFKPNEVATQVHVSNGKPILDRIHIRVHGIIQTEDKIIVCACNGLIIPIGIYSDIKEIQIGATYITFNSCNATIVADLIEIDKNIYVAEFKD